MKKRIHRFPIDPKPTYRTELWRHSLTVKWDFMIVAETALFGADFYPFGSVSARAGNWEMKCSRQSWIGLTLMPYGCQDVHSATLLQCGFSAFIKDISTIQTPATHRDFSSWRAVCLWLYLKSTNKPMKTQIAVKLFCEQMALYWLQLEVCVCFSWHLAPDGGELTDCFKYVIWGDTLSWLQARTPVYDTNSVTEMRRTIYKINPRYTAASKASLTLCLSCI